MSLILTVPAGASKNMVPASPAMTPLQAPPLALTSRTRPISRSPRAMSWISPPNAVWPTMEPWLWEKPPRALIGKHSGDVAEVHAPGGVREYEILDVKYL